MIRFLKMKMHQIGKATRRSAFLNKYFPKFQDRIYWAGNRQSFARAGFIGSFCMMLPIPFQMLLGSVLAYYLRANIPLATALAWITNPLTMWPIWYGGYVFGTWLMGTPSMHDLNQGITLGSSEWFSTIFPMIWQPFLVGNISIGVLLGTSLYLIINYFSWTGFRNKLYHLLFSHKH